MVTYQPKDIVLTVAAGTAPWTPVETPKWYLDKEERERVWLNTKIPFLSCAGGVFETPYTYMNEDDSQCAMKVTDDFPGCLLVWKSWLKHSIGIHSAIAGAEAHTGPCSRPLAQVATAARR